MDSNPAICRGLKIPRWGFTRGRARRRTRTRPRDRRKGRKTRSSPRPTPSAHHELLRTQSSSEARYGAAGRHLGLALRAARSCSPCLGSRCLISGLWRGPGAVRADFSGSSTPMDVKQGHLVTLLRRSLVAFGEASVRPWLDSPVVITAGEDRFWLR
jgi:hypothetical protein